MRLHKRNRTLVLVSLLGGALVVASAGCTQVSRLAILSDGDLSGRQLSGVPRTQQREGEDCGGSYYLANATRNALRGSGYDTLVDVEVTSTAGIVPFQQCIKVKGWAVRSSDLPRSKE